MKQSITKFLVALSFVLLGIALVGCSGGGGLGGSAIKAGSLQEIGGGATSSPIAAPGAAKVFAANGVPSGNKPSADYRIAPLDVLEISVFGVKDLDRTVQVSSSGQISLPLIKAVQAGGKTQAEVEREIAAKLNAGYLQSPQVSVFVKEYNSQRITVDGAVQKPGIFPISGDISLLQAIALAQGLNEVADPSGVILFRTVNGKRMAARFDIKQVRTGKTEDPMLQAGDIVMVDESSGKTTLRDVTKALPLTGLFNLLLL